LGVWAQALSWLECQPSVCLLYAPLVFPCFFWLLWSGLLPKHISFSWMGGCSVDHPGALVQVLSWLCCFCWQRVLPTLFVLSQHSPLFPLLPKFCRSADQTLAFLFHCCPLAMAAVNSLGIQELRRGLLPPLVGAGAVGISPLPRVGCSVAGSCSATLVDPMRDPGSPTLSA